MRASRSLLLAPADNPATGNETSADFDGRTRFRSVILRPRRTLRRSRASCTQLIGTDAESRQVPSIISSRLAIWRRRVLIAARRHAGFFPLTFWAAQGAA